MKFTRTQEIEIVPENIDLFIRSFSELTALQATIFFCEFGELEQTSNNAMKLFEQLVVSKAFALAWNPFNAEWILPLWNQFKKELKRGYHIGMGKYKPYPKQVIAAFSIQEHELPYCKERFTKAFGDQIFISFMHWSKVDSQEILEDQ